MPDNRQMTQLSNFSLADRTLSAFLDDPATKPPRFLIEGIFPERSITLLTAQPGSGKSMLTMDMVLHIASGQSFADFQVAQAPVLFVGEDSSSWDYAQIARKLISGDPAPSAFYPLINERFQLDSRLWVDAIKREAAARGVKGIVLDSLRFVHRKDENKSDEMQVVMNEVREIAESTGAGVLLIHHPPKPNQFGGGSDFRGSSVILASCDFHMNLTSTKVRSDLRDLSITFEKGRCAETPDQLPLLLSWGKDWARIESNVASKFHRRVPGGEPWRSGQADGDRVRGTHGEERIDLSQDARRGSQATG